MTSLDFCTPGVGRYVLLIWFQYLQLHWHATIVASFESNAFHTAKQQEINKKVSYIY